MPTPRPEGMTGFLYETVAALRSDTAKRPADEFQQAQPDRWWKTFAEPPPRR
jgi:hypothetical protein